MDATQARMQRVLMAGVPHRRPGRLVSMLRRWLLSSVREELDVHRDEITSLIAEHDALIKYIGQEHVREILARSASRRAEVRS